MALHLIGFPHTRLDGGYETCAYTQKIRKMRRMNLGRELVVYGCEGADVEVAQACRPDDSSLPSWPSDEEWDPFNEKVIEALRGNVEPRRDIILLAGGYSQRQIQDAYPGITVCEPGVGYKGIVSPFCAFESYAWRHHVYGLKKIEEARWFDTVIPNYFDLNEFPLGDGGGDYLLFVGRVITEKGISIAVDVAKATGLRLLVAGPGDLTPFDPARYATPVGVLRPHERAALMGGARALLAPTHYIEPFGGVAVEAQLCGTPAITSNIGAFTETVPPDFRFSTIAEAVHAVDRAEFVDRARTRASAAALYSIEAVAPLFEHWFANLDTIWGDGFYEQPTKSERRSERRRIKKIRAGSR